MTALKPGQTLTEGHQGHGDGSPNSTGPVSMVGTVLVVDPDGVSRRVVELALTRIAGLAVETTKDAAGAQEILRNTVIDLIVSETALPDMAGLAFFRILSREARTRVIPFVFLSSEARVPAKVTALKSGVDDYIVKPCDVNELSARCLAIMERQRRLREAFRKRSYTLAGDFTAISFADLAVMLEMGKRSGMLVVVTRRASGALHFDDGQLVHAVQGNLMGPDAFFRMMAESSGSFEFSPGACTIPTVERTIQDSITGLLMEGARLLDEGDIEHAPKSIASIRLERLALTLGPGTVRISTGLMPNAALATAFEQGITDGFSLGDLQSWSFDELRAWTHSDAVRERFHVLVLADMAAGISALLALASPPTEQWVLQSLRADAKALGLTFYLRRERLVDVVLVDIRDCDHFRRAFVRTPSCIIVAPPNGDLLATGLRARTELEELLTKLAPVVVLGVGNAALPSALRELGPLKVRGLSMRTKIGALGDGQTDLRALLLEATRLWGEMSL